MKTVKEEKDIDETDFTAHLPQTPGDNNTPDHTVLVDAVPNGHELDAQFDLVRYLHELVDWEMVDTVVILVKTVDDRQDTLFTGNAGHVAGMLANARPHLMEQIHLLDKISNRKAQ